MGIKLYCGLDETKWNNNNLGNSFCISPIWGKTSKKNDTRVKINSLFLHEDMNIIQDSGAFSDSIGMRLSFQSALYRQIEHAHNYKYEKYVTHRASYDVLIDEKWEGGKRKKKRWSEDEAKWAINETIQSALFLSDNRNGKGVILSAQGVSTKQYVKCSEDILSISSLSGDDMFGLGGWCIIGIKRNSLRDIFREIIIEVIPKICERGLKKVHIWGSMYAPALGELLWICNKHNLKLSTDSSGVHRRPYFGIWGYADWKDKSYVRPQGDNEALKNLRARHTLESGEWLLNLENSKYYKSPHTKEKW